MISIYIYPELSWNSCFVFCFIFSLVNKGYTKLMNKIKPTYILYQRVKENHRRQRKTENFDICIAVSIFKV